MKHTRALTSLGLLTFSLLATIPSVHSQIHRDSDSMAVRQLENRFHQAFLGADTENLGALLTADFVWMHGDGAVWTKDRLIGEFRSGKLRYKHDDIDHVKVTMYGPTAVVVGHDARQYTTGDPFDFNYTTTYVKQNGEWRVALFHTSHCPCARQEMPSK